MQNHKIFRRKSLGHKAWKTVLRYGPKAQYIKENINTLDFFYKRIKRQVTDWEKNTAIPTSDKGLT